MCNLWSLMGRDLIMVVECVPSRATSLWCLELLSYGLVQGLAKKI